MEERKLFVCKFCNKRYTCGKSLGGHIRTHMTQHSSTGTVKFDGDRNNNNNTDDAARKKRKKRDLGSDYGLRENPRKTSRFVHSNPSFVHHEEKFCKECGKGFPSLKALCGHMACHSEKEKQKLAMMDDTQSDTETCVPKGSKRMRFMALNSHNNLTSSSVSELEQEEEEEVAMCLMLLSKDLSSQRDRFALLTESNSENNSVVLEAKSPSVDTIIAVNSGKNKNKNSVCNIASSQHVDKKVRNDDGMMKFKFSDSGCFRYGSKKVDSGVSIDVVLKNDVFKRKKVGDRYGFEDHDVSESRKKMMNNRFCRSRNTESKKSMSKKLDYSEFDSSRKRVNHDYLSRKNKKNGFPSHENYNNGSYDSESYQKSTESTDSDSDTDSDSYPSSSSSSQKQESKAKKKLNPNQRRDHECPICNKTFGSGQALGGHKRSHFVGGFEENNTLIIKQDSHNLPSPSPPSPAGPCLIDLNLPPPVD